MIRIVLGTLLLAAPLPGVAQGGAKEREAAFVIFLQSVAAQQMSRLCVRGMAGYRERFEYLFPRWRDKHPEYRAKLAEMDRVMAGLAKPPGETGPLVIDNRLREECERILENLNKGLN